MKITLILFLLIASTILESAEGDWEYDGQQACWDMTTMHSCLDFVRGGNTYCIWCNSTSSCMEYNPCSGSLVDLPTNSSDIFPQQTNCTYMIVNESSSSSSELQCKEFEYWFGQTVYYFSMVAFVCFVGCLFCNCIIWCRDQSRKSKYERV